MANPEHVEILRSGVEKWNAWREGGTEEPELRGADLGRVNLRGANLRRADLWGAYLRGANLSEANLSEAYLRRANLSEAHLINTDLIRANLSRADLTSANLSGVDLTKANLSEAYLRRANLTGAKLSEAYLSEANLSKVNLSKVNLRDADLSEAELFEANLNEVDFSGSTFAETAIGSVDLSKAIGLDSVDFLGPCSIDHRTLERSGPIPISFLQGCGFSDEYIQYVPSLFGSGIEFFSAFISYSSADKKFARRLHDALQGKGVRCWLDEKQILPGDDILRSIDEALRIYDKVLLCCSDLSLSEKGGWWIQKEIDRALEKELNFQKAKGKNLQALIPLDLDGFLFSDECVHHCGADLRKRNAADFTEWKDHDKFEAALEGVVKVLRADEGARIPLPKPRL